MQHALAWLEEESVQREVTDFLGLKLSVRFLKRLVALHSLIQLRHHGLLAGEDVVVQLQQPTMVQFSW